MLEPQLQAGGPWLFSTSTPSLADISLYYQLEWGNNIAKGYGLSNLTGGGTSDTDEEGTKEVFYRARYPALHQWYLSVKEYFDKLPPTETRALSPVEALQSIKDVKLVTSPPLISTPSMPHSDLDKKLGLVAGAQVLIAPDDTGRNEYDRSPFTGSSG